MTTFQRRCVVLLWLFMTMVLLLTAVMAALNGKYIVMVGAVLMSMLLISQHKLAYDEWTSY